MLVHALLSRRLIFHFGLNRWLDTSVDLRKRNEELKELQLDLRIATREAKALKGAADQSEQLRQQVEELRCLLDERVRAEEVRRPRIRRAHAVSRLTPGNSSIRLQISYL